MLAATRPALAALLLGVAACHAVPAPAPREDGHALPPRASASAPAPPSAPSASAPAEARTAPLPPPVPPKILVLGDSLTDPKSHGGGFLDHLRERCPGLTVANFAKGGFMVNQMRRRFVKEVLPGADAAGYTHLLVFGGVNDLYSDETAGRTPEKVAADLTYLFDEARARKWKIVALTVAPWGGFKQYDSPKRRAATARLNRWILGQAAPPEITVLPTGPLLTCGDSEVLCADVAGGARDGLHFGREGHRRLGEALRRLAFPECDRLAAAAER
jgi:lysophospholipase L1-like esterase